MGRVYRAESEDDGAIGALKILDSRWAHDAVVSARFEEEARALRQLDHPHVVRVLATAEADDGRFCLVMEFVDGCDLGRLLRAEKLSMERAMDIFQKVCAAVAHAHEHGLVHRDIKPGNILIGREGTLKLVDFGLAKDVTLANSEHSLIGSLTSTTDQFGTAYYIAPERFTQRKAGAPATDVYSLGVLLYHLLTGQMPLGNYTPLSRMIGVSPKWDQVIAQALEADPAKRTSSVAELDAAVRKLWLDHLAGTDRKLKRRRWLIAVGVTSIALIAAIAGAAWQWHRTKPKPVVFASPRSAIEAAPWMNSLGMKFVPVPGTKVLFSVYETRRRDVEEFIRANNHMFSDPWNVSLKQRRQDHLEAPMFTFRRRDGTVIEAKWDDPGWPITPDHPMILATVREMLRYCLWLTWKEQGEGRLKQGQRYRLPTDAEWLAACGGPDAPLRPGNRAGPEARDELWPPALATRMDRDAFPRTAPVGSFPAELYGLYDMSGNVAEWVSDAATSLNDSEVEASAKLRGPCFGDGTAAAAAFSNARTARPNFRIPTVGARLVLELEGEK
jgi:serine/threonine protein kinase